MDGSFRQIKVAVNAPGHLTVRTRSGYYATDKSVHGFADIVRESLTLHAAPLLATDAGLPPAPVAQPVSSLAHRNVLGMAGGEHRVPAVLGLCLAAAAGTGAVFALGGGEPLTPSAGFQPGAPLRSPVPQNRFHPPPGVYHKICATSACES